MPFSFASDGIDPTAIPSLGVGGDAAIPAVGLGTFGSDNYRPTEIGAAVLGALEVGYRHIDCASVYGNEREVGEALASGIEPEFAATPCGSLRSCGMTSTRRVRCGALARGR